jgi:hypothetical protein
MQVLDEAFDAFEASRELPCPSCGAVWVSLPGTYTGREMAHSVDCAYMAARWPSEKEMTNTVWSFPR